MQRLSLRVLRKHHQQQSRSVRSLPLALPLPSAVPHHEAAEAEAEAEAEAAVEQQLLVPLPRLPPHSHWCLWRAVEQQLLVPLPRLPPHSRRARARAKAMRLQRLPHLGRSEV